MNDVRLGITAWACIGIALTGTACRRCPDCAPDRDCSYELRLQGFGMIATGGNLAEYVLAPSGCRWAFKGDVDWVTVEPGTEGEPNSDGNGTVVIKVAPNAGPRRVGTATIAFQKVRIDQAGTDGAGPCTFSVFPAAATFGAAGGAGAVAVVPSANDCGWYAEASSAGDWVHGLTGSQRRVGPAVISYTVTAGAGGGLPRNAEIFIRNSTNANAAVHSVVQNP